MKRAVVLITALLCCSCERGRVPSGNQAPPLIKTAGGQEMVLIPAGEFTMGSDRGQPDEAPPHKIRVKASYWIAAR